MADTQSILKNLGRTAILLLVMAVLFIAVVWLIGLVCASFHVVLPVFVVPIIGFIFVIFFIYFTCKIWGWNFTF